MLEGSIAVTGALIQWLRDRLKIISSAPEVEELARTVDDNGGVYFVPAFSGLFAPQWRDDARGVIVGLTAYANQGHIARAALEATAWQSREVVDAANEVADVPFTDLRVDGGMTANELLMQFQADVLGVPVIRPAVTETTALGAAYAAGLAVGFWSDQDELRDRWSEDKRWEPQMSEEDREAGYKMWLKAVERLAPHSDRAQPHGVCQLCLGATVRRLQYCRTRVRERRSGAPRQRMAQQRPQGPCADRHFLPLQPSVCGRGQQWQRARVEPGRRADTAAGRGRRSIQARSTPSPVPPPGCASPWTMVVTS